VNERTWTVNFEPRALVELKKLDPTGQRRIVRFLQERVVGAASPRDFGKPLTGDKVGLWRYRVGDYRVVCRIEDDPATVLVLRIAHRREVYR
jgi:mRNA interferase RelE/StbE